MSNIKLGLLQTENKIVATEECKNSFIISAHRSVSQLRETMANIMSEKD